MTTPQTAPYGTWRSPITTDTLASNAVRLGGVALDGDRAWWCEGRPSEGGRNVLVHCDLDGDAPGPALDLTPAPFNVRSRVHEYGGGAFTVRGDDAWFVNDADQRIYHQRVGATPRAITAEGPWRFADLVLDPARARLLAVREDHTGEGEPRNDLVAVALEGGAVSVLADGHDFFACPRPSPDGRRLAYLTWDHPDMPWDATTLWVARLDDDGAVVEREQVPCGERVAVCQPAWSPDGELFAVADGAGWWNLHVWRSGALQRVRAAAAEYAVPHWQFANPSYGFVSGREAVCATCEAGRWQLERLNLENGEATPIETGQTDIDHVHVAGGRVLLVGGSPTTASAVVLVDLAGGTRSLRSSGALPCGPEYVSTPEPMTFDTGDGDTAHAFYYPPRNPDYRAPAGERAPLVVMGHGGPTGATTTALRPAVQFWTSRGFGVCDVNYRGSTGYGRAYRDALAGAWGVADVEDCVNAARHLVAAGRADGERLAIRGGSAGGYTTLAALVFHDVFSAGASYYGISELESLASDTHKFESRYLDRLIGPYPAARDVYQARSPINHVDGLSCPAIFFQGLEDKVVPPSQAEMMVDALRAKGLPVAYLTFEGEQHGFRKAETIVRTLEAELWFYGHIFGFEPADEIEPVDMG